MKKVIYWKDNGIGIPFDCIKEIHNIDSDIQEDNILSESEIEDNIRSNKQILKIITETNLKKNIFRFSNSTSIDTNKDYRIQDFIKKEVGLENKSIIVTEYYEKYDANTNEYNNIVIREEKEYIKRENSPLFNFEILKIKYFNQLNEILFIKSIETPLSLGYQMTITAKIQELKIIKASEYIISELGYIQGLLIHTRLINEIKQYERMIIEPLKIEINLLNELTESQKNILKAILFDEYGV